MQSRRSSLSIPVTGSICIIFIVLAKFAFQTGDCCQCSFHDTAYLSAACGTLTPFLTLLQTLIMTNCNISDSCRRAGSDQLNENECFDFIIVGAGVAGPIIARRLSDNPWWKVLLIEAGPEEPSLTALPGLAFDAKNTILDWRYWTEPTQPHPTACLETDGKCYWPRGKMISGTSGMNGMMYVRGHPEIYNTWARSGNPGWSYGDIEYYFRLAENPAIPGLVQDENFENRKPGPLIVERFPYKPEFSDELLSAAAELRYRIGNLYEYHQTGFMVAPMLTSDGLRGTTSRYYLRPVSKRKNLRVLTNAYVTRVIINDWESSVKGVELIDSKGRKRIVRANKEVILTAGAIGSPQILLNSGIGPKEDLNKLGIKIYKDLPVGRVLMNHVSVPVSMSIKEMSYETLTVDTLNQFFYNRTGPFTSTGLTQVTGFLESSYANPGIPDLQIFFDGYSSECPKSGQRFECSKKKREIGSCPQRRKITARPTNLLTISRGHLKLKSNDPLEYPLLYPNYFTNELDIKVLIEGIRKVIQLTETETMKKWDLRLEKEESEYCSIHQFNSDAYWECIIRTKTGPENHQAGTCKMGPIGDPEAVVDSQLRIHGISNLRVADPSIFPTLPNSNPMAAIVMTAEKAADMVRKSWCSGSV